VRQPNIWQAAPGSTLAGGSAQVGVDLAGNVALQATVDFLLGFPLSCAASGVGAGGGPGSMRVSTIPHKAWLAWRSPPGLSRWGNGVDIFPIWQGRTEPMAHGRRQRLVPQIPITISEELGDSSQMAVSYAQLSLLAEDRAAPPGHRVEHPVRVLIRPVSQPMTGTGLTALARLTHHLGLPALGASLAPGHRPVRAAAR
jgi:hypothetical protein